MSEYITKDAVFDLLHGQDELILFARSYKENGSVGERLCNAITRIPAEDVEPVVRGTWIEKQSNTTVRCSQTQMFCSACGKRSGIGGIISNQIKPFCPNCGAHMSVERSGSGE